MRRWPVMGVRPWHRLVPAHLRCHQPAQLPVGVQVLVQVQARLLALQALRQPAPARLPVE